MKTKILTLAIILFGSIATFAQTYHIINGTVTNIVTGAPVQYQAVYIAATDSANMYSYNSVVYTNQNGFYADTIYSALYQITFYVSTSNCNGTMATGTVVSSFPGTLTLNFTVQCTGNCTAYFYASQDSINSNPSGLSYQFYDASNPSGGGSITSWYWDFGDATTSTSQYPPIHTYSIPGWYNVCLTIATGSGCTATYCDSIYADTIGPCLANFQYNLISSTTVSFSGLSNVSGVTYSWDFGDGTTSANQNPIHSYMNYGTYTVCLTISNANIGCTDTYCHTVVIANPVNCTAYFYAYSDSTNSNLYGLSYQFYDASNPSGGGSITSWYWDFGDGSHSITQNPSYTYSIPGWYNVCLTIATDSGCTATYCDSIYADTLGPCQANFQYNLISSTTVSFSGFSNVGGVTYSWNFGDGTTSANQNPIHSYMNYGTYTVCLTISNANIGCTDTYCHTVVIANPVNCTAYFYAYSDSTNSNLYGLSYQFYDASNPSGGSITSWYWDFGDGSHSITPNPFYTYAIPGWYNVCLTIATDSGCTATYCDSIYADTISSSSCQANFQYCVSGTTVSFYGYSNVSGVTYSWDFGDGTVATSLLSNPIHVYNAQGTYTVCLTITNTNGCTDTYCQTIVTGNPNPSLCNIYVIATSITNESSTGAADGAIDITVIGGTPPYMYIWSNSAVTQNISGLTAGYYDVTVTDSAVCQTWASFDVLDASDSANWNYNDTLITNIADTCFNFQPASANIYSYSFPCNDSISITWIVFDITGTSYGFVTLNYSFDSTGYYLALLTIDCDTMKSVYNFTDQIHIGNSAAGIHTMSVSDENIMVFPNPVADNLNISINLPKSDQIMVNILNAIGQTIHTEKSYYESGQKLITINTSSLPQGLYLVQLNYNGQKLTRRFVK